MQIVPRVFPIAEMDEKTPLPQPGDDVQVILRQREDSDIHEALLEACILVVNSGDLIKYTDFSVKDSGILHKGNDGHTMLTNVILTGVVSDVPGFMESLFEAKRLRDDEYLGDELANFSMVMEQHPWTNPSCQIPDLFKSARIEQLLYWLQWESTEEDQKPDIAKELVDLDPSLKEVTVVSDYL